MGHIYSCSLGGKLPTDDPSNLMLINLPKRFQHQAKNIELKHTFLEVIQFYENISVAENFLRPYGSYFNGGIHVPFKSAFYH